MKWSSSSLVVKEISVQITTDSISYLSEDRRFKSEKNQEFEGCRTTGAQIKAHESVKLYA